jgi:hypothetical protein
MQASGAIWPNSRIAAGSGEYLSVKVASIMPKRSTPES